MTLAIYFLLVSCTFFIYNRKSNNDRQTEKQTTITTPGLFVVMFKGKSCTPMYHRLWFSGLIIGDFNDRCETLGSDHTNSAPWNTGLLTFDNIGDLTTYWSHLFIDTCKYFLPYCGVLIRRKDKPWITSKIKTFI